MLPTSAGESDVPPPILEVIRNLILPVYLPSAVYAIAHNAIQILLPLYALKLGGGFAMAAAMPTPPLDVWPPSKISGWASKRSFISCPHSEDEQV